MPFLFLILLIHLFFLVNTRFTLWPEMVVYPFLLNNGFLLYKDIINPYPPLFTSFLAIFSNAFGYKPFPYQILTWGIILITDITIFIIAKKILKKTLSALTSVLFFVVFSIPFAVNGLWFDLVQTPIILVTFYYFYKFVISKKRNRDDLFFSIFFLTIAFFIKQQVLWLLFWFLIILIFRFGKKVGNIFIKNVYVLIPLLVLSVIQMILFWQKNLLGDFLYWSYYFPFFKASKMPGYILLPTIRQLMTLSALFLLFIPVLFQKKSETKLIPTTAFTLVLFAYPRFDYFHLIPSISILSLAAAENFKTFFKSYKPVQIIFIVSFLFLSVFTIRYITRNWGMEIRFFEKDIIQTASILKRITTPQDLIYIQNGPDQLLPLIGRLPTKPWAIQFPWYLEIERTQNRILEGLISQKPRFVIYKPYDSSVRYEIGGYRPEKIASYIEEHYRNLMQISDTLWLKIKNEK